MENIHDSFFNHSLIALSPHHTANIGKQSRGVTSFMVNVSTAIDNFESSCSGVAFDVTIHIGCTFIKQDDVLSLRKSNSFGGEKGQAFLALDFCMYFLLSDFILPAMKPRYRVIFISPPLLWLSFDMGKSPSLAHRFSRSKWYLAASASSSTRFPLARSLEVKANALRLRSCIHQSLFASSMAITVSTAPCSLVMGRGVFDGRPRPIHRGWGMRRSFASRLCLRCILIAFNLLGGFARYRQYLVLDCLSI